MEIHAHVPKIGKSATHWLLEAIFIVASVGLGFALAGYRESNREHELVGRVLTTSMPRWNRTSQSSPRRLPLTARGWTRSQEATRERSHNPRSTASPQCAP